MSGRGRTKRPFSELFPSWGHVWLFGRVAAWTAAIIILLRLVPLSALMRMLTPRQPGQSSSADPFDHLHFVFLYANRLLAFDPENRRQGACLPRSLVLYRFARLAALPAVFCLGVQKKGEEKLEGHSWIEIHGEHLYDPLVSIPFTVTFSYPPTESSSSPGASSSGSS